MRVWHIIIMRNSGLRKEELYKTCGIEGLGEGERDEMERKDKRKKEGEVKEKRGNGGL